MWFPYEAPLPECSLPEGLILRSFQAGDEASWCQLLNANAQLGFWNQKRVEGELKQALVNGGQYFVANEMGTLVACAGVYDRIRGRNACWEIGWIAIDPAYRGRGVGGQVALEALRFTRKIDKRPVFLCTDDFRIPALKTYLRLGFIPDRSHLSYDRRWKKIFGALGPMYAQYQPSWERE